ncbi:hypothetical protein HK098_000220, partial [Nowakowskiella sp. JEL0407]
TVKSAAQVKLTLGNGRERNDGFDAEELAEAIKKSKTQKSSAPINPGASSSKDFSLVQSGHITSLSEELELSSHQDSIKSLSPTYGDIRPGHNPEDNIGYFNPMKVQKRVKKQIKSLRQERKERHAREAAERQNELDQINAEIPDEVIRELPEIEGFNNPTNINYNLFEYVGEYLDCDFFEIEMDPRL